MNDLTKEQLKKQSRKQFLNNHKDNRNYKCLVLRVKGVNGDNMARYGWQLIDSIVNEVIDELATELSITS